MSSMSSLKTELDRNWNRFRDSSDFLEWLCPRLGNAEFFEPFREDMLARFNNKNNKCPLCQAQNVLYAKVWDGTLGASFLCMCDYFMRTGELYYPNVQLPSKLNSHRGYNILRFWFHALQHPKKRTRQPSWLPTVSGLEFVLHDQVRTPFVAFVNREVVIGLSQVDQKTREEYATAGGSQIIPNDLCLTFREVLAMGGYQADLFLSIDQTDVEAFKGLFAAKKKASRLKYDSDAWKKFWYDHLMLAGGWDRLKVLESQQAEWKNSVNMFELERAHSLAWREENMDAWRRRAAEAKRIVLERGDHANK